MDLTLFRIFTITGFYFLIGWIIYLWISRRRKELEAQERFIPQLLEKFESPEELTRFLESPAGEKLIRSLAPSRKSFRERLLFWLNIGIVLTVFGIGMIILGFIIHDDDCMMFGAICLFPGIGLIISSYISHRLAIRWQVNGQPRLPSTTEPPG